MVDKAFKPSEKIRKIYPGGLIEPPSFMPSYYEWLFETGQQVIYSNFNLSAGVNLITTVPQGYNLYITQCNLSGICVNPAIVIAGIYIFANNSGSNTDGLINSIFAATGATPQDKKGVNSNVSFNPPLELKENEILIYNNIPFDASTYCIVGFLVPKNNKLNI